MSESLTWRASQVLRAIVLGAPLSRSREHWQFHGDAGGIPDTDVMEFLISRDYVGADGSITSKGRDFLRARSVALHRAILTCAPSIPEIGFDPPSFSPKIKS